MAKRSFFGRPVPVPRLLLDHDDRNDKYHKLSRRKGGPRWRTRWGIIAIVLVVMGSLLCLARLAYSRRHGRDRYELDGLGLDAWRKNAGGLRMTHFLSHSPGYSTIQNLYWRNYTFHILTDQPWTIPKTSQVVDYDDAHTKSPKRDEGAIKVWAVRNVATTWEVDDTKMGWDVITPEQAQEEFSGAEVLDGPMLLSNDDVLVGHYYHIVGEILFGAWRQWANLGWRSGLRIPPNFKVASFVQSRSSEEKAEGFEHSNATPWPNHIWEDMGGAARRILDRLYPGIRYESQPTWQARADLGKMYRVPLCLLTDKWAGQKAPTAGGKGFGDVIRLPVPPNFLTDIRNRILAIPAKRSNKLKVMYLTRQGTWRIFSDEHHKRIMDELKIIEQEQAGGVVTVVESFGMERRDFVRTSANSEKPYEKFLQIEDQIAAIADVDILVALHGNGLTNVMWMNPGSIVLEIMPPGCSMTDFAPLAIAAGVEHYQLSMDSKCDPWHCPKRGCTYVRPDMINGIIDMDIDFVFAELRAAIKRRKADLVQGSRRRD